MLILNQQHRPIDGEGVMDTTAKAYYVSNLYDIDYLVDGNQVVVLQGNRAPSLEDLQGIAAALNEREQLREALRQSRQYIIGHVCIQGNSPVREIQTREAQRMVAMIDTVLNHPETTNTHIKGETR